jgi:YD repeat-containing protein
VTRIYDLAGRPLSASDGNGAYTYTYDTAGRVLMEVSPGPRTIQHQWDANGNPFAW